KVKPVAELSLLRAAVSLSSILLQLWLAANLLAVNIYQMTYNSWVTIVSCTNNEAEMFSMLYSYVNFISVFVAPALGVLVDCLVRRARRRGQSYRDRRTKEIQANIVPLLLTTVCTFCMYLPLLFFHPAGVYCSLVFMALTRPCIVAVATAYLRIRFPVEHFNRLVGIHFTVASALIMLQFPQYKWSQHMYLPAHATMLVIIAVSALNPLHLLVRPLFVSSLGSERQA
ncbi:Major facilitator superfamily domain, partial [Trinorchestia longiramus]